MNILEALDKYYVKFGFSKVTADGEYRPAMGSRNLNILPKSAVPNGHGAPEIPGLVRYYDLDKKAWRSFYIREVKFFYPVDSLGYPI